MTLTRSKTSAAVVSLATGLAFAAATAHAEPPVTFLEPFPDVLEHVGVGGGAGPEAAPASEAAVADAPGSPAGTPVEAQAGVQTEAELDAGLADAVPDEPSVSAVTDAGIPPPQLPPERRAGPEAAAETAAVETPGVEIAAAETAAAEAPGVERPAVTDPIGGPLTPDMLPGGADNAPFRGSAGLAEAIGPSIARDVAFGFAPRVAWVPVTATFVVAPGDTLAAMFTDVGVAYSDALEAIMELSAVWDPRRLQIGQQVALTFQPAFGGDEKATLVGFEIDLAYDRRVSVMRDDFGQYTVRDEAIDYNTALSRGSGIIDSSLYADGDAAGIPARTLAAMTRALSYDVDFQRDIQPGDAFEAVFEQSVDDGGAVVATGPLVYVSLTLSGDEIAIYRFTRSDGSVDFFTADGVSVVKALLRTPVDAARISSNFGMRRHPVLGYSRMHTGTDFAAPTGTPVYAAGDGAVAMAGWNNGYGNYVRIRHNGRLQSAYAHMSRIARGIAAGTRVEQGQVIGFVGSTGLSTGPHLHFEVLINGAQVDPLSVELPPGEALAGADLERFESWRTAFDETRLALPTVTQQTQISHAD